MIAKQSSQYALLSQATGVTNNDNDTLLQKIEQFHRLIDQIAPDKPAVSPPMPDEKGRFNYSPDSLEKFRDQQANAENPNFRSEINSWLNIQGDESKQNIFYFFGNSAFSTEDTVTPFVRFVSTHAAITKQIPTHVAVKTTLAGFDLKNPAASGVQAFQNVTLRHESGKETVFYDFSLELGLVDASNWPKRERLKLIKKDEPIISKLTITPIGLSIPQRKRLEATIDARKGISAKAIIQEALKGECEIKWTQIYEDEAGGIEGFSVSVKAKAELIAELGSSLKRTTTGFSKDIVKNWLKGIDFKLLGASGIGAKAVVEAKVQLFHPTIARWSPEEISQRAAEILNDFFKQERYQPVLPPDNGDVSIIAENFRRELMFGANPWKLANTPKAIEYLNKAEIDEKDQVGALIIVNQLQMLAKQLNLISEEDTIQSKEEAGNIIKAIRLLIRDPKEQKATLDVITNPYKIDFGDPLLKLLNDDYFKDKDKPVDYILTREIIDDMYRFYDDITTTEPTQPITLKLLDPNWKKLVKKGKTDRDILYNLRLFKRHSHENLFKFAKENIEQITASEALTKFLVETEDVNTLLIQLKEKGRYHAYNQLLSRISNYITTKHWAQKTLATIKRLTIPMRYLIRKIILGRRPTECKK